MKHTTVHQLLSSSRFKYLINAGKSALAVWLNWLEQTGLCRLMEEDFSYSISPPLGMLALIGSEAQSLPPPTPQGGRVWRAGFQKVFACTSITLRSRLAWSKLLSFLSKPNDSNGNRGI